MEKIYGGKFVLVYLIDECTLFIRFICDCRLPKEIVVDKSEAASAIEKELKRREQNVNLFTEDIRKNKHPYIIDMSDVYNLKRILASY